MPSRREYDREYFHKNRERILARQKRRYAAKRATILANLQAKRDAARHGEALIGVGHA